MEYQVQIQEEFEESSEILLKEFLKVGQQILSNIAHLACSLASWVGEEASLRVFVAFCFVPG